MELVLPHTAQRAIHQVFQFTISFSARVEEI